MGRIRLSARRGVVHPGAARAVIAVHIAAALFYLFVKRENLIHPMLTGLKHLPAGSFGAPPRIVSAWLGLAVLAVAAVADWLLVR